MSVCVCTSEYYHDIVASWQTKRRVSCCKEDIWNKRNLVWQNDLFHCNLVWTVQSLYKILNFDKQNTFYLGGNLNGLKQGIDK